MKKIKKSRVKKVILATCGTIIGVSLSSVAMAGINGLPPIVNPAWVHSHLKPDHLVVVTIGDKKGNFVHNGHIPGSLFWNNTKYSRWVDLHGNHQAWPSDADMTKVIDAMGLNPSQNIVLSGNDFSPPHTGLDTRAYVFLRAAGFKNVTVLNGGTGNWLEAGYHVIHNAPPSIHPSNYVVHSHKPGWVYALPAVYNIWKSKKYVFVDARPGPVYAGKIKPPMDKHAGHIPGAIDAPSPDVMTKMTTMSESYPIFYQFKSNPNIRAEYKKLGVPKKKPIMLYCDTGLLSSEQVFAGRYLLGLKNINYFPGSIRVWSAHNLPQVKGYKPG
jgi:thiosulfate/3-mercaptopyruvate sulfurtransferase